MRGAAETDKLSQCSTYCWANKTDPDTICLNRNDSEIEIELLLTGLSRNAPTNIGRINYLVQICRWDDYSHFINNRSIQKLTGDWDARVLEFKKKGLILRHKQGNWGSHGNFCGPLSIVVTITK